MDLQDCILAFSEAMADAGLRCCDAIIADGELHRYDVDGDKKGRKNGWYCLNYDSHPAGAFGSWKGEKYTWRGERAVPLTPEEKRRLAQEAAAKKKAREAAELALQEDAAGRADALFEAAGQAIEHPYLVRKGVQSYGLRIGTWVKESRPDPVTGEVRTVKVKNALLVPMRDERKRVWSVQAIFEKQTKIFGSERDKDFIYGGRKKGLWHSIGKPVDATVLVGEGYATCASVHAATGHAVLVAFDAGNLIEVARKVRAIMPSARIGILADNDAWTTNQSGQPWNTGVEKATAAAEAVGGILIVPKFTDVETKPTDFNDLHKLSGLRAVADQVGAALNPPPEPEPDEEAPPWEGPPADFVDPEAAPFEHAPPEPARRATVIDDEDDDGDDHDVGDNRYFRVLGYDREHIYVYSYEKRMVIRRGVSDWSESAMIAIADLNWWENNFPAKGGFNKKMAHNWLVRTANRRGYFDPDLLRGRGAWRDEDRVVYHIGDRLVVDGEIMPDLKIKSSYVYEQARRLHPPADTPMSNAEGKMIIEAFQAFSWKRPASAILAAGWCALAPLCGALRWRPHMWITGGTGSGKSTLLNSCVLFLMNGACVYAQGNSTEAGVRQTLKIDSLPVMFDESEQNNRSEKDRMQPILAMIRQSSTESEAKTLKGTSGGESNQYLIRSMFCLASVQVGIEHQADVERFCVLDLKSKRDKNAAKSWATLSAVIAKLRADRELPARLMRRSLELLPVTLANIDIFAQAGAKIFGSQREGDQFGALLAGAWSMTMTRAATLEEAEAMIKRYDWSEYTEDSDTEEGEKALGTLLGTTVRLKGGIEASIYELVCATAGKPTETCDVSKKEADGILRRNGMIVKDGIMMIAHHHVGLSRLMIDTPYASDLKGQFGRTKGAFKGDTQKFAGVSSRCTCIPLVNVVEDAGPIVYSGEGMPF